MTATTAAGVPGNLPRHRPDGPNEGSCCRGPSPADGAEIWEYQLQRKTEGVDSGPNLTAVYSEDGTSYVDGGLSCRRDLELPRCGRSASSVGTCWTGTGRRSEPLLPDTRGPVQPAHRAGSHGRREPDRPVLVTAPAAGGGTANRLPGGTLNRQRRPQDLAAGGPAWVTPWTYSHTGLLSGDHPDHYRVAACQRLQRGSLLRRRHRPPPPEPRSTVQRECATDLRLTQRRAGPGEHRLGTTDRRRRDAGDRLPVPV